MKRVSGEFFEDDGGQLHHESHVEAELAHLKTLIARIRSSDLVAGVEVIWASDVEKMAVEHGQD